MKRHISVFVFLLLTTAATAFSQTSWLDRPLNNWNNGSGTVPNAPRTLVAISAQCQSQVRQPDSIADRSVTRAGWSLFGAAQTYGQVAVVNAMAGTDGMCRPSLYNTFVFVNGRYAGSLSPTTMESRSDGSLSQATLTGIDSITAEFARYRSSDALCCPSQKSIVTYSITAGNRTLVRANDVTTIQTCDSDGGGVSTQDNVVSGTVTYRQRIALPATAALTVKLVDVSRADASATTIVEQRIDTAGKQVPFSFDTNVPTVPMVKAGRVRAIAVTSAKRLASLPDVPSLRELGVPIDYAQWSGLFVPAGTPEPVVVRLREAAKAAANDERVKQVMTTAGSPILYLDAPEFQRYVDADAAKMAEIVKKVGKLE